MVKCIKCRLISIYPLQKEHTGASAEEIPQVPQHKGLGSKKDVATNSSSYTVTLRFGQLSPKVPPCSLKVMRFHTAIMVSSGTLKWNSSTLAKDLKALSLRGVRVKYSVTKRQSVKTEGGKMCWWIFVKISKSYTGAISFRKLKCYHNKSKSIQLPDVRLHNTASQHHTKYSDFNADPIINAGVKS